MSGGGLGSGDPGSLGPPLDFGEFGTFEIQKFYWCKEMQIIQSCVQRVDFTGRPGLRLKVRGHPLW